MQPSELEKNQYLALTKENGERHFAKVILKGNDLIYLRYYNRPYKNTQSMSTTYLVYVYPDIQIIDEMQMKLSL